MPQQVIIHCKSSYLDWIQESELNYKYSPNGEIDLIVDDVPYTVTDGYYQDHDEQLCEHYGIDYNQVNCIELA